MVVLGAVGYNSTLGTAPGRESSQKGVVCKEEPRKAGVPLRSTRYTCGGGANVALLKIENRELKTKQTTVQEHVQPV